MVRVIVDDNFRRLGVRLDETVKHALQRAAETTVIAAKTAETRVRTGQMHDQITATPVVKARRGWMVIVYDPVFYARFQEFGTHGKHGAKHSNRQKDYAGNRGVKPLRFLRKAAAVGRQTLLEEIRRAVT